MLLNKQELQLLNHIEPVWIPTSAESKLKRVAVYLAEHKVRNQSSPKVNRFCSQMVLQNSLSGESGNKIYGLKSSILKRFARNSMLFRENFQSLTKPYRRNYSYSLHHA